MGGHTAHGEEEHGRAPADGAEAALNALLAAAGSRRGRGGHLLGALQGMWSWTAEQVGRGGAAGLPIASHLGITATLAGGWRRACHLHTNVRRCAGSKGSKGHVVRDART